MLKGIENAKFFLQLRRSYLIGLSKNPSIIDEMKTIDNQLAQLKELQQLFHYYDCIPNTFEEFLNSDYIKKAKSEVRADFKQEKKEILREFSIIDLFSNFLDVCKRMSEIRTYAKYSVSSFYEKTLNYFSIICPCNRDIAKCILFQDKFESYFNLILNEEEQHFYKEIKEFIKTNSCKDPKKFSVKLYSFLKKNPKFIALLKTSSDNIYNQIDSEILKCYGSNDLIKLKNYFLTQNINEFIQFMDSYYRAEYENLKSKKSMLLSNLLENYKKEWKSWSKENLLNKYNELKSELESTITDKIYGKIKQILTVQYGKNSFMVQLIQLEKSLYEIYNYLIKKRNFYSMSRFFDHLTNLEMNLWSVVSEIAIEFPDEEPKKKKNTKTTWTGKITSFLRTKWKEMNQKLKYVPQFDSNEESMREVHKEYIKDQGCQILLSIQNQFQSMKCDKKWKEEMVQKFPILVKNEQDISISDLKNLPDFFSSLYQEVKIGKINSFYAYQALEIPDLPQDNFFIPLFLEYFGVDLTEFDKMNPEDIKYFIEILHRIWLNPENSKDDLERIENLSDDSKKRVLEAYFCAKQYMSNNLKR